MAALQPVLTTLPTLAVAAVYCFWYACEQARRLKQRRLRERVTWMLWVMANDLELSHED